MEQGKSFSTPIFVLLIFALAFALRLCFVLQWQDMPYGASPQLDADIYDKWAWDLAHGKDATGVFYQSPLYPYLLSLLYRVVGHSYLAASILNAVLDSGTVVLLGLITRSLFGNMAAIITGILAACYAPMIFYTAPVMKEPFALLLLTSFLFTALYALRGTRLSVYALCGFFLGLAVLARGNALLLVPIVPVFAWLRYRRRATQAIAAFLLATVIAFAPVAFHNWQAEHDFVPIGYDGGFNLYIGHSPTANGTNAYPPEVSTGPEQERIDTSWIAEQSAGHALKPSEISTYWRDKAVDYALTHLWREVQLLGLKFFAFWNHAEQFDNYDAVFIKQIFPSLLNVPLASFAFVVVLALAALVCGRVKPSKASDRNFLLACVSIYMLSVLIFYVTDRYRLPVVIFLLPLAGAAMPAVIAAVKENDYRRLSAAVVLCGAALAFMLHEPLDRVDLSAFDWAVLTTIYADENQDDAALNAYRHAMEASPIGAGVQAYIHAASIYEKRGQLGDAEALIKTATILFPQDGVALYNLGRIQALRGDIDDALATMQHARVLNPTYGLTYFALAKLYDKKGEGEQAHQAIEKGLSINPADTRLLGLLTPPKADETK